jgi:hypothetical protein
MTSMRRCLGTTWAARALVLLGLLGFVVGWANACVHPQPPQLAGGYELATPTPAPPGHAHHAPGDIDAHACNAASDDAVGLCDSPQRATPKSEAPRLLDGAAWHAAIPALAAAWVLDRVAPHARPQTSPSPSGISVVLRFLRLTL